MKVLVVSPHPDDEVLGAGGTITRLASEGNDVTVAIVTKGWEPLFDNAQVEQVRAESLQANKSMGIKSVKFMDMPVTKLDAMEKHKINHEFDRLMDQEKPQLVFLPFPGDRHKDHTQVFDASMVALRPVKNRRYVQRILCYETVSETHWYAPSVEPAFEPQLWIDISDYLQKKLEAMSIYKSQLQTEPEARSLEAISALAKWRGSVVGFKAAEAFVQIRESWPAL